VCVTQPESLPTRLRVVVVDADRRVRDSLSGLLGIGDELEVVGRTGQPAAALDLCRELSPDVVVVDPRLPEVDDGLELVREVRSRCPDTIVLVLSWPGAPAEQAVGGLGADGFVSKSDAPHQLAERIVSLTVSAMAGRLSGGAA
jgi:DNA-binding NarL/FixJ family response regulator